MTADQEEPRKIIRRKTNWWKRGQTDPWATPLVVSTDAHNASIDELPPPGVKGKLSGTPPSNLGGVTSYQLDESREKSPVISHAEESLPPGDRD